MAREYSADWRLIARNCAEVGPFSVEVRVPVMATSAVSPSFSTPTLGTMVQARP